jgi:hypothetical protein
MRNLVRILLCATAVLFLLASSNTLSQNENRLFFKSSKPITRWWWFAATIQEKDVKANLDWVKRNNFGGVEIAWVYPLNRKRFYTDPIDTMYTPRQEWLSPEWSDIVAYAKQYADSIGLSCDFTFGTGWPFGDTHIGREDATQNFHEQNDSVKWTYAVVSWEYPRKGFILNHMDSSAFNRYAQRMGSALQKAFAGSISGLFCDSWEVETAKIWTSGFDSVFHDTYGYDVTPYMESIYSKENADVRYDYMKLVARYVLNQFYKPFAAKCRDIGAFSRVQCAGAPIDLISGYASVDVPETEAMLYEPPFSRIVASAACLASHKEVSSESFTCTYGFPNYNPETREMDFKLRGKEQVADLKLIADALFANGVNQIIWHGMPFNPIGIDTIMFYASVHVGSKGNLSKDIPAFNEYMEKVAGYMKQGRTFSDVAVYLPVEDSWMAGRARDPDPQQPWAWGEYEMRHTVPSGELKGYNPIWISGDYLNRCSLREKKLVCGDGLFSLLYIDADYVDLNALKTILSFAKQGLQICMKRTPQQPGKKKSAEYEVALKELSSLKDVSRELDGISMLKPLVEGSSLPDFWCRKVGSEYYFFFADPRAQNLHLPLQYGQALTNETILREVVFHVDGNSKAMNLQFKPYQSLLVKVDQEGNTSMVDITYNPPVPAKGLDY